jgi:uncharacterized protein YjiS (DUF1127 family)
MQVNWTKQEVRRTAAPCRGSPLVLFAPVFQEAAMTTIEHATHALHAAARPAIMMRAATAISAFWRSLKNRRAFYRLGEMSDRQLADIGLTRADLSVAVDLPFGYDPTSHLGAMARERILRTEAQARQVH